MGEQFGGRLHTLGALARVGARLASVDTNPVPATWRHLTKIDPEDDKPLPLLYQRYLSVTDAVVVGGSTSVTAANTEATFALLDSSTCPVFHEPSHPSHVTARTLDAAAFVAIPQVLNGTPDALVGELGRGIARVREELAPALVDARLPWWTPAQVRSLLAEAATAWLLETAVFEAYLVQNPASAAAREAGVSTDDVLSPDEAAHRALAADRYLRTPVVYVEYSGAFGGDEGEACVAAVDSRVSDARVWYGGGLRSGDDARRMLAAGADAVVVGNVFHDIALEERSLFERLSSDPLVDDVDALTADGLETRVAAWIDDTVPVAETAAASYLSTVPQVGNSTRRARTLLVETLLSWLRLDALDATPDAATLTAAYGLDDENGVPSESPTPASAAFAAVKGIDHPLGSHLSPWGVTATGSDGD